MKIAVISNHSTRRCGFAKYSYETVTALARAGHQVVAWDGVYEKVYARREAGEESFLPPDAESFDVIHVIWHANTMNHYNGATWPKGPVLSLWNGGPSDAYCPFADAFDVKWSCYPLEGHRDHWYPVLDWVKDLPPTAEEFTVGATSVRGDGISEIIEVCGRRGWATNLPVPDQWLSLEDEVQRLAYSTVNVCWYNTPDIWKDRAGAPATALASGRPLLITRDSLLSHLWDAPDIYHGRHAKREGKGIDDALQLISEDWEAHMLRIPRATQKQFSWTRAVQTFEEGWAACRK